MEIEETVFNWFIEPEQYRGKSSDLRYRDSAKISGARDLA